MTYRIRLLQITGLTKIPPKIEKSFNFNYLLKTMKKLDLQLVLSVLKNIQILGKYWFSG